MSLLCTDHLELAPTIADPDELSCAVCDDPGAYLVRFAIDIYIL